MSNKVNKLSETIAAQASAQGVSGISVIRVSGDKSKTIAKKVTGKTLLHMKAQHTDFLDSDGAVIDSVIVLFFALGFLAGAEGVFFSSFFGFGGVCRGVFGFLFYFLVLPIVLIYAH